MVKFAATFILVSTLLLTACGVSDSSRLKIINGVKVASDDPILSHTAAIVTETGNLQCSAAAIAPNLFITAAHCVYLRDVNGWTIRLGSTAGDTETLDIEKAITHENFDSTLLNVDNPATAPNDLPSSKQFKQAAP